MSSPPPALGQGRSDVPPGLDAVFQRMIAKKPADRLQSMAEVVKALEAIQRGDSVTNLAAPPVPADDAKFSAFLSNLGSGEVSRSGTIAASAVTKPAEVGSQFERTVTTSDGEVPTDPQTLTSLPRGKVGVVKRGRAAATAPGSGGPAWWQDRRLQAGAGGLVLLLLALFAFNRGGDDAVPDGSGASPIVASAPSPPSTVAAVSPVRATPAAGPPNFALRFDESTCGVSGGTVLIDGSHALTIEAWVRIGPVLNKIPDYPEHICIHPLLQVNYHRQKHAWQMQSQTEKTRFFSTRTVPHVETDAWVHVAGILDGDRLLLYVDGQQQLSQPLDAPAKWPATPGQSPFSIGAGPEQVACRFHGLIDEVRISKVARYTQNFTPQRRFSADGDTLALYHFDEGTGTQLADASSHRRPLRLFNESWGVKPKWERVDVPSGAAATPASTAGDWLTLFDESGDTSAWETLGPFQVQGGLLLAKDGSANAVSRQDYADFELEAEWKIGPSGNSGVYYREAPTRTIGAGNEYQMLDDAAYAAKQPPLMRTGSLYGVLAPSVAASRPVGEWNLTRIVCRGTQVEHWLNGQQVVQYDTASDSWKQALSASTFAGKDKIAQRPTGRILLQGHTGEAAFRSIRVRRLDAATSKSASQLAASKTALDFSATLPSGTAHVKIPGRLQTNEPLTVELYVTAQESAPAGKNRGVFAWGGGPYLNWLKQFGDQWVWAASRQSEFDDIRAPVTLHHRTHLAAVRSDKELRLFVDGRSVGRTSLRDVSGQEATVLLLGGLPQTGPGTSAFRGTIDSARITKGVLYQEDFTPPTEFESRADTLVLYRIDEGAGALLHDSSGHGHDGQIVGATWVDPTGAGQRTTSLTTPHIVPITELNQSDYNTAPWPSQDGLRLYWESAGSAATWQTAQTFVSARPDENAPFGPPQPVADGRMPTLSEDELELVCVPRPPAAVLHVARRSARTVPFGPLTPLALPGAPQNAKSPCLLPGGTRMVLQDGDPQQNGIVYADRALPADRWKEPSRLPGMQQADHGVPLTWPFMDGGGLRIWYGRGGDRNTELWFGTRDSVDVPFSRFQPVQVDGQTLIGRAPRYCTATRELFFSRPVGEAGWELAVVKNFDPNGGKADFALQFDGVQSMIELPPLDHDGGPLTIEARVWMGPQVNKPRTLVRLASPARSFTLWGSSRIAGLVVKDAGQERSAEPNWDSIDATKPLNFAGVWDGQNARFYIDGKRVRLSPQLLPGKSNFMEGFSPHEFAIAWSSGRPTPAFDGIIDEVRISKTARYSEDYSVSPRLEADEQTLALYHFDEGSADILHDSSGRGHDGKILGATWVRVDGDRSPASEQGFPAASQVIDLAALLDLEQDRVMVPPSVGENNWSLAGGKLTYASDGKAGKLVFPVDLADALDFEVALNVKQLSGRQVFNIDFATAPAQWSGLDIGIGGPIHLRVQSGQRLKIGEWPASAPDGGRIVLRVRHARQGQPGALIVTVDGIEVGRWEGDVSQIGSPVGRHPDFPGTMNLGLFCYRDSFEFTNLELRVRDGSARLLRQPPAAAAMGNFALDFSGPSDVVTIPTLSRQDGSPVTIECWLQPRQVVGDRRIVMFRGPASINLILGNNDVTTNCFQDGAAHGLKAPWLQFPARPAHLASVWDGRELRLYIDGRRSGNPYSTQATGHPGGSLQLGGAALDVAAAGANEQLDGVLDEVRVSSVARYDADFTPTARFEPDASTLALYHCDEGTGEVLRDSSSYGHDGKIVGATWLNVPVLSPPTETGQFTWSLAAEREAVEWILAQQGTVSVQLLNDAGTFVDLKPGSTVPAEPFVVRFVDLRTGQVQSDDDVARLARCRFIETLNMTLAGSSAKSLPWLREMPQLRHLGLSSHKSLKSSDLAALRGCPSLQGLDLTAEMVDDELAFVRQLGPLARVNVYGPKPPAVAGLAGATHLRSLLLTTPDPVDDAALIALQQTNPQLRIVVGWQGKYRVVGTDPATEAARELVQRGVEVLGGVNYWKPQDKLLTPADFTPDAVWSYSVQRVPESLQLTIADRDRVALLDAYHLAIDGQRAGDDLAVQLGQRPGAISLTFTGGGLTDAGLAHLHSLAGLRSIALHGTQVTEPGVQRLREALPYTFVSSDFGNFAPAMSVNTGLAAVSSTAAPTPGSSSPPASAGLVDQDWTELFNGRDLDGWLTVGDGSWRVQDGVLTATGNETYLVSEREDLQDFECRIEYRVSEPGNGGLLFRGPQHSTAGADYSPMTGGYEVQMSNQLQEKHGGLYRLPLPLTDRWGHGPAVPSDQWITLDLAVTGQHIVTKVNGQTIVEIDDAKGQPSAGPLALQYKQSATRLEIRRVAVRRSGAPTTAAAPVRSALDFDGVDDYVELPTDWQYDGGDLSFEAWIVPEDVPVSTSQMLLVLDHGAADARRSVRLLREHTVLKSTGAARRTIQLSVPDAASLQLFEDTLATGRLTHLAAVWRGGVGQLFIDGQPQMPKTGSWTFAARQVPAYLWLGALHSPTRGPIDCWQGQVQQIRLSTGVLYSAPFEPARRFSASPTTVALYKFTDGEGDVLTDASGHNRHAKIVGPTWVRVDEPPAAAGDAAASAIDLLQNIDPDQDGLTYSGASQQWEAGGWLGEAGGLRSAPQGRCLLRFGHVPQPPYRITVEAIPGSPNGGLWVPLAVGGSNCYFTTNGFVKDGLATAAFAYVEGQSESGNPTCGSHTPYTVGQRVRIDVDVDVQGDQATLVGWIDGVEESRFTGVVSRLSIPENFIRQFDNAPVPSGVGTTDGSFLITKVEIGPPPPAAATAGTVSPVPPKSYALALSTQDDQTPPHVLLPIDLSLTRPFTIESRVTARSLALPREHRNVWHNRGCFELKQYGDRWAWAANGTQSVGYNVVKSSVVVVPNVPTQLAGVFTGTERLLFVEGKLTGRTGFKVQFDRETSTPLLGLGAKFDPRTPEEGGYSCFDGLIDEVRLSSTARFTADYVPQAELEVDADTLALYHCDDGAGSLLRDLSRGFHGQIVNGRWVQVDRQ